MNQRFNELTPIQLIVIVGIMHLISLFNYIINTHLDLDFK